MNGKRLLDLKYKDSINQPFKLDYLSSRLLSLLLERDHAATPDKKESLNDEIAAIARTADFYRFSLHEDISHTPFTLEVFCAFGFEGNQATAAEISRLFDKDLSENVLQSLELLTKIGFLTKDGESYQVAPSRVVIDEEKNPGARLRFLQNSMQASARAISDWLDDEDLAYFESGLASVKLSKYKSFITEMKGLMLELQNRLESNGAEALVRYKFASHPVLLKK